MVNESLQFYLAAQFFPETPFISVDGFIVNALSFFGTSHLPQVTQGRPMSYRYEYLRLLIAGYVITSHNK